ncbi:hypothetical protein ACFQ3S_18455 [Mucilaginibacter terrae]|uniref:hypothetical protein n=1 Tax=Mucilaginibacter terrae TaxID=1955052 RepID=UPI003626D4B3
MTTLRVTVDDEQVDALKHLLRSAAFVKDVQEEKSEHLMYEGTSLSVLDRVKALLAAAEGKNLFADIKDPVEWQRQLRKEWERDI